MQDIYGGVRGNGENLLSWGIDFVLFIQVVDKDDSHRCFAFRVALFPLGNHACMIHAYALYRTVLMIYETDSLLMQFTQTLFAV